MLQQDLDEQRKLQREYAKTLKQSPDNKVIKALGTEAQAKEFYIMELIERIKYQDTHTDLYIQDLNQAFRSNPAVLTHIRVINRKDPSYFFMYGTTESINCVETIVRKFNTDGNELPYDPDDEEEKAEAQQLMDDYVTQSYILPDYFNQDFGGDVENVIHRQQEIKQ